jgi:hypothetical protein
MQGQPPSAFRRPTVSREAAKDRIQKLKASQKDASKTSLNFGLLYAPALFAFADFAKSSIFGTDSGSVNFCSGN